MLLLCHFAQQQGEETTSESLYPAVKGRRYTGAAAPALENGMGGGAEAMSVRARDSDHDGVHFHFFAITSSPPPQWGCFCSRCYTSCTTNSSSSFGKVAGLVRQLVQAAFLACKLPVNIPLSKPVFCFGVGSFFPLWLRIVLTEVAY